MSFPPAEPLPRVVLDSNVWIDILVFDDPATRPIAAALADGHLDAVIDAKCRAELARVLDYPQFERFAIDKQAALALVDRWTTLIALPDAAGAADTAATRVGGPHTPASLAVPVTVDVGVAPRVAHASGAATLKLPQCRDRDDQKFLELAYRAHADWLVSKDRELLRMNKRIARDFGFSIGLPVAFVDGRLAPPSARGN